ncbi:hypothetical protein [Microbispora bryophytorum]|uniref:hypothetical protein n=1 Tax=Microbispora bryophytorum TaxID=1460882 RepID=UPI0033F98CF0
MMIEAARNQEGAEPATEFLDALADSRSRKKRRYASDAALLLEEWARLGHLEHPLQQRQLRGDLWEVKTPAIRLPYYEFLDAVHGRIARLTHGFEKEFGKTVDGKTPHKHINMGLWMIEEDRKC